MSTKKVIGGSVAAIVILIIAQLAAQLAGSALNLIKIPDGICNIIAGIFYVGLTYVILKIYIEKVIRLPVSDFGMPVFHIKRKWILIAILLPLLVKGSYLLFFQGAYVSSHINGKQISHSAQLWQVEVQAVAIQCHFADIGTQTVDAHSIHLI